MNKRTAGQNTGDNQSTCPQCGKRIAAEDRAGSLTSYLFQSFNCNCSGNALNAQAIARNKPQKSSLCPDCGLKLPDNSKVGSLTGFLFQDTRCKCPPRGNLEDGEMARRFWKLKEAGMGNSFGDTTFGADGGTGAAAAAGGKKSNRTTIDLLPGAIIGGTYKIIELIGSGGMGEVYLAQHLTLKKNCALKLIPPDQVTEMSWQRFQSEAKLIAGLDHINLVKVSDLGIHEGCLPFYAMEYIEGATLEDHLIKRGTLTLDEALNIFIQVCDGVDYAHRNNIVHRDIKPANIMLLRQAGGKFAVKILDFGLVKLINADQNRQSLTAVGDIFGSPFYMSPEQCVGGKIDNRSDIYSVGCTLFECLTGRPPFVGNSAVEIVTSHQSEDPPSLESVGGKTFPQSMEVVIAKLLRKNPVERYQTLLELRGDLERVSRGENVQPFYVSRSRASSTDEESAKDVKENTAPLKNRPLLIATVAGLVLVLLVGGGSVIFQISSKSKKEALTGKFVDSNINDEHTAARGPAEKDGAKRPQVNKDLTTQDIFSDFSSKIPTKAMDGKAPLSLKDTAPFSEAEPTVESGKAREFHFPKDIDIGRLTFSNKMTAFARGDVHVPAHPMILFSPSTIMARYPSYLKRFRPGEIFKVEILLDPGSDNDSLLKACSQIRGVGCLDLISSNDITVEGLKCIDDFGNLKDLRVLVDNSTVATIAKLKALKTVDSLYLFGEGNLDPIMESIKNNKNISRLCIVNPELSERGLEIIAALPNLKTFDLNCRILTAPFSTNAVLSKLRSAPQLTTLNLQPLQIDSYSLKLLQSFKTLKLLQVETASGNERKPLLTRLRQALPNIAVQKIPSN